ncbi:PREDICTED: uncharacterized protein LOC106787236 [Polistes canadensis]|uniref:uncharacterized protein LOC106787236 n=1 Tax=Polistes canadensis TaxID=91411 RepID=UPI000718B1CC|nr:PREDICTED: uncharacterized protein LOC106787236 [Polistes canadensis]
MQEESKLFRLYAYIVRVVCSYVWWTKAILLYPSGSVFQITLGASIPVRSNKRGSIVFSSGFQYNYYLPSNVSDFESTIVLSRHIRDLDLRDTYTRIEHFLEEYGWGNGRECLLRSICELAEVPLLRKDDDIIVEAIHFILTPSEDLATSINSTHRNVEELYRDAERLGKSGVDCTLTYPDCIESPLKSFTEILFP